MDKLTAYRTFSKPGYTPTKWTRIHKDNWYLVTMQNIERGQGDYMGLGEGEYQELLPGIKARERRDAHLNHCNRIAEYDGPVYELLANQYGGELHHVGYFATIENLSVKLDRCKASHDKWIVDCHVEMQRHEASAQAIDAGTGKSIMSAELHRHAAEHCLSVINGKADAFRCDAKRIR